MTTAPRIVSGHYSHNGALLPRVSTVLGIIAQPGLDAWRRRVGDDEAARVSRESTDLGTRIHAACERINRAHMAGLLFEPRLRADTAPYSMPYLGWFRANVREVLGVERFVHHPRYIYAGTFDLLAVLTDGSRALVDIKSSKSPSGTWPLQLAAYALALAEAGETVDRRLVVNLPSNRPGTVRVFEYTDIARDDRAWLAALRLWRWNERHKDDWRTLKENGVT